MTREGAPYYVRELSHKPKPTHFRPKGEGVLIFQKGKARPSHSFRIHIPGRATNLDPRGRYDTQTLCCGSSASARRCLCNRQSRGDRLQGSPGYRAGRHRDLPGAETRLSTEQKTEFKETYDRVASAYQMAGTLLASVFDSADEASAHTAMVGYGTTADALPGLVDKLCKTRTEL